MSVQASETLVNVIVLNPVLVVGVSTANRASLLLPVTMIPTLLDTDITVTLT